MITVDFNELEEGGRLTVSISDSSVPLVPGWKTVLTDGLGSSCVATVKSVFGDTADLRLDWSTWNKPRVFAINGLPKSGAQIHPDYLAKPKTGSAKTVPTPA